MKKLSDFRQPLEEAREILSTHNHEDGHKARVVTSTVGPKRLWTSNILWNHGGSTSKGHTSAKMADNYLTSHGFVKESLNEATKPKPKPKSSAKSKTGAKDEKPKVDNLSILKNIVVKNKADTIAFTDGNELDVEPPEANAIVSMYSRLTKENKDKVLMLLTKGVSTFMKLTKFAMSQ